MKDLIALLGRVGLAALFILINFWKNVAIAGGFLALAAGSPGGFSLDARLRHEA